MSGEPVDKAHYERSDISVVPAAGVIGEAMVMLTLARFVLEKTGGDSMPEVIDNLRRYRERIAAAPEPPVAGGRPRAGAAVGGSTETSTPAADGDGEAGSGGDD